MLLTFTFLLVEDLVPFGCLGEVGEVGFVAPIIFDLLPFSQLDHSIDQ